MDIILEQQARHLHRRNMNSFFYNIANSGVLCFMLRNVVPHTRLLTWFSVLMAANFVRFMISVYYNNKPLDDYAFQRSLVFYSIGMSMTILVWSASSFVIYPTNSIPHQIFLALILVGVLARATPILSVNKNIYKLFIVIVLSPIILKFAFKPTTEMHVALAFVLTLYGATLYKSATFLSTSFKRLYDLSSELKGKASQDALTEVANRQKFDELVQVAWKTAIQNQEPLSLLMMDIDQFKAYNDTYGHQRGDECIRTVAKILKKSVLRNTDYVARYGGEEFAIVLTNTDAEGAAVVAERIRHHVELLHIPHKSSYVADHVTTSIGAGTIVPSPSDDVLAFINVCDQTLYQSKDKGRNCVTTRVLAEARYDLNSNDTLDKMTVATA